MGFREELENLTLEKILYDRPMKKHTSFGVGGKAKYFVETRSLYSLNNLLQLAKRYRVKTKVIGNGSNLLISDEGFNGLIICTKGLDEIFFKRDQVRAMAGAPLFSLLTFNLNNSLTGIEALSGIPATVGGAVVMNAGAFGRTISDCIVEVETLKGGKIKKYYKEECKFAYRTSRFYMSNEAVVSATFKFKEGNKERIEATMRSFIEHRKNFHPQGRSCGSVFKNPNPERAGALIDKAGLKGLRFGGARVSEKHGNFIVTDKTATATDVYHLILHVKEKVNELFGIELKEEVEYVGEF
ncbi:MAG: UDP-N-acetylmuramate dehydrogenase [Clostridiales bacterium]|nr:UDP-N-acetylmuramate dehydrogenase [Clostridiales bacterium]